jgi:hypothetical protein
MYLSLKDAIDIRIIHEVHEMFLNFLINVLLDINPIEIGTENVARKVADNFLRSIVLWLK